MALGLTGTAAALPAAAQGPDRPGEDTRAAWMVGLEVGHAPAVRLAWEATAGAWTLGATAGVGPGGDSVRARLLPSLRVGRALPVGLRLDAGLGFETTWLTRADHPLETEIQWEGTAGWWLRPGVLLEAGARRTDYHEATWETIARVGIRLGRPSARARNAREDPRPAPLRPVAYEAFGVPPAPAADGRLRLGVAAPRERGRGLIVEASNPRGDADPWTDGGPETNVDRLGAGAEARAEIGSLAAWARWRSDLHADTSIGPRIRPVALGAGFPVTIALAGGASWTGERGHVVADVRRDPRAFPWMPHLGEERTARMEALAVRSALGPIRTSVHREALDPIGGRTVEPLEHWDAEIAWAGGAWTVALAYEKVTLDAVEHVERARRISLAREGALFGRLFAGDDASVLLGVRTGTPSAPPGASGGGTRAGIERGLARTPARWPTTLADSNGAPWAEVALEFRTRPELMEYDGLLQRGWMHEPALPRAGRWLASGMARAGIGSFSMHGWGGWGLPLAGGAGPRVRGGWIDAHWNGPLGTLPLRGAARARIVEWGPGEGWWKERATVEGRLSMPVIRGPARVEAELRARTALESVRTGLREPGGLETSVALGGPVPALAVGWPGWLELRLSDVFDRGLAWRVGAPRSGRRLSLLFSLGTLHPSGVS